MLMWLTFENEIVQTIKYNDMIILTYLRFFLGADDEHPPKS